MIHTLARTHAHTHTHTNKYTHELTHSYNTNTWKTDNLDPCKRVRTLSCVRADTVLTLSSGKLLVSWRAHSNRVLLNEYYSCCVMTPAQLEKAQTSSVLFSRLTGLFFCQFTGKTLLFALRSDMPKYFVFKIDIINLKGLSNMFLMTFQAIWRHASYHLSCASFPFKNSVCAMFCVFQRCTPGRNLKL